MPPFPPFRLDPENRLALREGGGCLSVFGLPFLAAGLFMLLAGLGFVPVEKSRDIHGTEHLIFFLMGLAFTGAGSALVFGRKWLTVDRTRGIVVQAWGLGVPMKEKTARLKDFHAVSLRFVEGDSDTADSYPVALEGKNGQASFAVASPIDFAKARGMASGLAEYLSLPLEDRTSRTPTVTGPGHRVEAMSAGSLLPLPPKPVKMKSAIAEKDGALEIFVPERIPKFIAFVILAITLPLLSSFMPSWRSISRIDLNQPGDIFGAIFFGFFFLFFFIPLLGSVFAVARGNASGTRITVVKGQIAVEQRVSRSRKGKIQSFNASNILSVDWMGPEIAAKGKDAAAILSKAINPFSPDAATYSTSMKGRMASALTDMAASANKVVLKTDSKIIVLAQGLPKDEAVYLCALIDRRLKGG